MNRKIVVTGLGAVTPLGEDFSSSWDALIDGRDAQAPLDLFDTSGCRCHDAASARVPAMTGLSAKASGRLSRTSRLSIPAAREALTRAGAARRGRPQRAARIAHLGFDHLRRHGLR